MCQGEVGSGRPGHWISFSVINLASLPLALQATRAALFDGRGFAAERGTTSARIDELGREEDDQGHRLGWCTAHDPHHDPRQCLLHGSRPPACAWPRSRYGMTETQHRSAVCVQCSAEEAAATVYSSQPHAPSLDLCASQRNAKADGYRIRRPLSPAATALLPCIIGVGLNGNGEAGWDGRGQMRLEDRRMGAEDWRSAGRGGEGGPGVAGGGSPEGEGRLHDTCERESAGDLRGDLRTKDGDASDVHRSVSVSASGGVWVGSEEPGARLVSAASAHSSKQGEAEDRQGGESHPQVDVDDSGEWIPTYVAALDADTPIPPIESRDRSAAHHRTQQHTMIVRMWRWSHSASICTCRRGSAPSGYMLHARSGVD
ncbi:hypothetical protein B0H13DRAFT_2298291 [Mycena leptocephala]|nr:hypothetical protein B0H13DRAFT_2298291 [Mycena leptocephala]